MLLNVLKLLARCFKAKYKADLYVLKLFRDIYSTYYYIHSVPILHIPLFSNLIILPHILLFIYFKIYFILLFNCKSAYH